MSAPSLAAAPPALRAPGAEAGGQLVDRYGRQARDLRLSITDKCNLRCTYCMPAQGLEWLKNEQLLSLEELVRLARIGVERLGIERIRITGGEDCALTLALSPTWPLPLMAWAWIGAQPSCAAPA